VSGAGSDLEVGSDFEGSFGSLDPILSRRAEVQRTAASQLTRRKLTSRVAVLFCRASLLAALVPLVAVLAYTIKRGISAWSLAFFTHLPTPAGIAGGGISNAIIGTLIIDFFAALMAVPLGVGVGLFLSQSNGKFAYVLRFGADVLAGIPSIVIGIFAYAVLVVTLKHFSAIAGSFGLAVIMLPTVTRASEVAIRGVPRDVTEAGLALGGRKAHVARRVVLPAALPGVITGVLLGIARAAGETAPLLFTAIGSQFTSYNVLHPMAAMPLIIYFDGIQAYPDLQQAAWGTALALIVIVFVLSVGGRLLSARVRRSVG
jgi:phosphate transport system permease protein